MRIAILLALAAALAAPSAARACGRGSPGIGFGGPAVTLIEGAVIGVVALDAGFTLWDSGSAVASHHPSIVYGAFELVFAAPQFGMGAAGLLHALGSGYDASGAGLYTLWMGALTAHSIWTLTTREAPPQRLSLGPTFVPVGQQSRTGFGLVGRF